MLLFARLTIGRVTVGLVVRQMVHKIGLVIRLQTAEAEFYRQPPLNPVIIPRHAIATPGNVAHGAHVRVADYKVGNV